MVGLSDLQERTLCGVRVCSFYYLQMAQTPDANKAPRFHSVDQETGTYLLEIDGHLQTVDDPEELDLLLSNVLEELSGKEADVCKDAACSRVLEKLFARASLSNKLQFLSALCSEAQLYDVAGSAFGSHVLENLLLAVNKEHTASDELHNAGFTEVLQRYVDAVCPSLPDYVTDKFATHVARALLTCAAGRDVLPPRKQRKNGAQDAKPIWAVQQQQAGGCAARYPALLEQLSAALCEPESGDWSMTGLANDTYASPFLQGLLLAMRHQDRRQVKRVVLAVLGVAGDDPADALAGLTVSRVSKLMKSECSSHLMQVLLAVAPQDVFALLYERFLREHLFGLSTHHAANFVVQAAIAATQQPLQLRDMLQQLGPHFAELLRRRRGGVLAALLSACLRLRTAQRRAARLLARAVRALPQAQGLKARRVLAPVLLTLDSNITLQELGPAARSGGPRTRLSTLGCSMLLNVLQMPPAARRLFARSVASLSGVELAAVAADGGGSRVVEAVLAPPAPARPEGRGGVEDCEAVVASTSGGPGGAEEDDGVAARVATRLQGHYADVAATPAGSYLVEHAFNVADVAGKEAIAAELAAARQRLRGLYGGAAACRTVGADAYAADPHAWRKALARAARVRREYESMFGDDGGGGSGGKRRRRDGRAGEQQPEFGGKGARLRHGAQGGEEGRGGESAVVNVGADEEQQIQSQDLKKRKRRRQTAADMAEQQATNGAVEGLEEAPVSTTELLSTRSSSALSIVPAASKVKKASVSNDLTPRRGRNRS